MFSDDDEPLMKYSSVKREPTGTRLNEDDNNDHEKVEDLMADMGAEHGVSPSKLPARQAKSRVLIKEEPESADDEVLDDFDDEDYQVEDEVDEDYGSKKRKIRGVRKFIPLARQGGRRARVSKTSRSDVEAGKGEKKKRPGQLRSQNGEGERAKKKSGGGRKKRISEMSEEERAVMKAKWREESRIKRARQRETMTVNEREELLRAQRERKRELRLQAKVAMTEDEKEQENKKAREQKKAKRALMTPEQRKEETQKGTLRHIERLVTMTEEEKTMLKMNKYFQRMARIGRMSAEEMEERKRRRRESYKRQRAQMTADDLERAREAVRQYKKSMSPDKKEQFLAKAREGQRHRLERLREDPEKWAKWKEDRLAKSQKMKKMGPNYVPRRKEPKKPRRQYLRQVDGKETAEERAERIRESRRLSQRRIKLKKKLGVQKLLERGMSMAEIQQLIETPEERERRLMLQRINRAKLNLRRRLEKSGVRREEIEVKLNELHKTYQPPSTFRPYKPRPDCWKPVTEDDLALLSEDIGNELKVLSSPPLGEVTSKQPRVFSKSGMGTSSPAKRRRTQSQNVQKTAAQSLLQLQHIVQTPATITMGQSQTYNVGHHDSTTSEILTPPGSSLSNQAIYPEVVSTQPTQDTSSDHGDYANSYDNPSPPPPSPPASPVGYDHPHSAGTFDDFPFQPPASTESVRKRGRPRKDEPPRPEKTPACKAGRAGPRGPKKSNKTNVIRDMVCDECGNAYNHVYLRMHKLQFHNPNYKNQTCQICWVKFNVARDWYTHYIRTHVEVDDSKEKPHMCDVCGTFFRQRNNLDRHTYYMHGDGMKKENFKRCPICPGEKLLKDTFSLNSHLRRKHPGCNRGGHECYRCDLSFPHEKELGRHVKEEHRDSYFPCQYCNACRFTKLGLNFHYLRCTKIAKETLDEMRKQEGVFSLDRVPLPCEFCKRNVAVFSLTRHYRKMHNVKEDSFTCSDCGKEFRAREFWVVHMEEKHLRTLDKMTELVRSLNVANREGLVVKNTDGVKGGVTSNTPSKAETQKRIKLGGVKRGRNVKTPKVKSQGGRIQKRQIVVMAEEEEEEMNSSASEEETDVEEKEMEQVESNTTPRRQIKATAEGNEDEQDFTPKIPCRQERRRVRWKPGHKSKTRKNKRNESEEEEEEEDQWKGSSDEEKFTPQQITTASGERRSSARPRNAPRKYWEENFSSEEEHKNEEDEEPDYSQSGDPYAGTRALTHGNEMLEAFIKQEYLSDGEVSP